jgi:4a-hydroxytetrahydrobiopterin dehydratase
MWENKNQKLVRIFTFKDFPEAFAFITKVALLAEKMNHHPNWYNSYNKVTIELFTHDAENSITEKDHKLAEAINKLF